MVDTCRKPLLEVCDLLDSKRVPVTSNKRIHGPYPYYGANGIQDYVNDYIFDDDLVLLAEDGGNFGSKDKPIAYRVSGKCWVNNHAHVLKPREGLNVDYLCYSLMYYDTKGLVNGATRKKLTQAAMKNIKIPILAYNEQLKIVKRIAMVSTLINNRKKELGLLNKLVKSRFIEMFGDPSKLNNFANAQIKDVASVGVGIVIKPTRFYSNDKSGKRAFRSLNIGPFGINPNSEWVYFTNEAMVENKRTIVHEGDVLIVRSGNPGTCCVVSKEYDGCNVIDLIIARPDKSKILPEYLCAFTNMPHGMNQINNQKHGVAQRHFNVSMYEKMKIYIPNLSLQQQYVNFMKQVDKSKMAVQKSLDELETLKKSLMQTYFG